MRSFNTLLLVSLLFAIDRLPEFIWFDIVGDRRFIHADHNEFIFLKKELGKQEPNISSFFGLFRIWRSFLGLLFKISQAENFFKDLSDIVLFACWAYFAHSADCWYVDRVRVKSLQSVFDLILTDRSSLISFETFGDLPISWTKELLVTDGLNFVYDTSELFKVLVPRYGACDKITLCQIKVELLSLLGLLELVFQFPAIEQCGIRYHHGIFFITLVRIYVLPKTVKLLPI